MAGSRCRGRMNSRHYHCPIVSQTCRMSPYKGNKKQNYNVIGKKCLMYRYGKRSLHDCREKGHILKKSHDEILVLWRMIISSLNTTDLWGLIVIVKQNEILIQKNSVAGINCLPHSQEKKSVLFMHTHILFTSPRTQHFVQCSNSTLKVTWAWKQNGSSCWCP